MTTLFDAPVSVGLVKNNARLIRIRWLAGLAVLALAPVNVHVLGVDLPIRGLYILGVTILAYNSLLWWASRSAGVRWSHQIAVGQVALDWLALATLVHLTGGVESLATHFFLIYVLLAPVLLPGRTAYLYVGLVIATVAGVIGLEAAGVLPHYHARPALPPNLQHDPLYIAAKLSFFTTVALATASVMIPIVRDFRAREQQTSTLCQSIQALSSSLDLTQVLNQLSRSITYTLQAKATSIRLLNETGSRLKIVAAYGLSKNYLDKEPAEVERNPIDRAALTGQTVIVDDTTRDERIQRPAELLTEGVRSLLCVALLGRRGPLGVLRVYGRRAGCFSEEQAEFVRVIAQQGAAALENAMAYGELQRTDEMKSQFVRAVTHELRAPVTGAQSLLRTVIQDLAGGLNDLQRDILSRLSDRLDSLQMLIDDLLDLAAGKVEGMEGEQVPVSLETAVSSVMDRLSPQAEEKQISLQMNYVPRGITVMANEEGLERIFLNLIGNAVKYTPVGGEVNVRLERCDSDAVVEVSDTGIGIPEADLPHLFEEFFRARNVKQANITGTGLGLTIAKDLVERYKGRISVDSKQDQGTTFTVVLPLAGETEPASSPPSGE